MPMIRTRDGQKLHVRVVGRGPPCMLVHGFASDSSSWLPFILPLLASHRFILPDLRGFGLSSRASLAGPCPLDTYAEDLAAVAEALSLEDVPLVGISMGALSAVRCFERGRAGRFSRYLHIDQGLTIHNAEHTYGLLGSGQLGFFQRMRAVLERLEALAHRDFDRLPRELRRELARVFAEFAEAAFTHPHVRRVIARVTGAPALLPWFLPSQGFRTHVAIMHAYLHFGYDLRAAFADITVPKTVLIGGASRMYPAEGQRLMRGHGAEVRELAGVGHMVPLEAPRAFLRELSAFLLPTR